MGLMSNLCTRAPSTVEMRIERTNAIGIGSPFDTRVTMERAPMTKNSP